MTPARPSVSVVIPCFNDGPALSRTLGHLTGAVSTGLEVVVIDNGSTDDETIAALTSMAPPLARVIHRDHGSVAAAMNLAFAHALGRYVCVLAPGVRPEAAFFDRATEAFETDESAMFVTCWTSTPDGVDRPSCDRRSLERDVIGRAPIVFRASVVREGGATDARDATFEAALRVLLLSLLDRGGAGVCFPALLASV